MSKKSEQAALAEYNRLQNINEAANEMQDNLKAGASAGWASRQDLIHCLNDAAVLMGGLINFKPPRGPYLFPSNSSRRKELIIFLEEAHGVLERAFPMADRFSGVDPSIKFFGTEKKYPFLLKTAKNANKKRKKHGR